ncbi:sterol desaturase family protein [Pikeienuella sp. HZG-20]|uniref:sterol desaturase family protein n=1 Tax=Paludibacillus litoralis TaxID=3133267 RepID=UPI0030ED2EFB
MIGEAALRLIFFIAVFAAMALWEWRAPLRPTARGRRWVGNLGLTALNTVVVRLLFPAAAVGAALDASAKGWGLFNALDWPVWLEGAIVFLALDFAIWAQHVVFHHVPALWRLHQVHHADEAMDVTTGFRFHPGEIAISMAVKIGLVYLLGAAALAVVAFEIALNAAAMFSHSNLRLGPRVERALRRVIVTPDMHRSHHSIHRREHDTNFGFLLSIWDRMFRVYTKDPAEGHEKMRIGLPEWRDGRTAGFIWSLVLPFRKRK